MIRKIEQTFDFEKLKRRTRGIINEQIITMYENADKRLQERLNRGVDYKNQKLQNNHFSGTNFFSKLFSLKFRIHLGNLLILS